MAKLDTIKTEKQVVKLNLGGKERVIKFDMNAFGVLEDKFGTVEAALESLGEGKIGNVKFLLWAGLIHDEVAEFDEITGEPTKYNITPYQVGGLVDSPAELNEAIIAMATALNGSLPEEPGIVEGKPLASKPTPAKSGPRTKKQPPKTNQ